MGLLSLGASPPLHLKMETEGVYETMYLKLVHVRALINNSHNNINKFTYSMVQSPSWEANWFAASQEIPRILWNPKVHYRTQKFTNVKIIFFTNNYS